MNRKNDPFQNIDPTLRELILAVFMWGILLGVTLIWLADSRISFVSGLAAGVLGAVFMACHMYRFIGQSLDMSGEDASKHMAKGTVIRIVVIVIAVLAVWKLGANVPAFFAGVLTLKLGAYTQPLLHRMISKIYRKEEGR